MTSAFMAAEADAVVHLMTAIPKDLNPRRLASEFALTNRLRTDGTHNLADASKSAGVKRVITQGLAYAYRPTASRGASRAKRLPHREQTKRHASYYTRLFAIPSQESGRHDIRSSHS
jgi:nucleoside-diphosphate-sugar epimerase